MPEQAKYKLEGLLEALEIWERNNPVSGVLKTVHAAIMDWALDRHTAPYQGAKRVFEAANLWRSRIPRTLHDGHVVFCMFWVEETTRTVRFDSFTTLALPAE